MKTKQNIKNKSERIYFFNVLFYNKNMKFINVGKIVNTFGIKGELKIVSRFEMPKKVFKKGNTLRINNINYKITNVRFHHHNYLVEINNIKDINNVEHLIGNEVYFNEKELNLNDDEYLISELVGYRVIDNDKEIGLVTDYDDNIINPLIKVNDKFYIPIKGNFIEKVDKDKKEIYTKNVEGLML